MLEKPKFNLKRKRFCQKASGKQLEWSIMHLALFLTLCIGSVKQYTILLIHSKLVKTAVFSVTGE